MSDGDVLSVGRRMGEQIWGKERFGRMEDSGKEMHPAFWDIALTAWSLFDRAELEPRIRSLCLVAALTVMGRTEELAIHTFGALNNGATPQEIEEAIVQTAPYGGLPTSRAALITAKKCFDKYQPKR
ncbi:MAG: carboxymuconolactone decarboxylase family protein [Dehalococcoidia bacterium]|jgi:alkylhydroperoxidase/carboxymuconolactone decarboxylase family protein YurZ|nr:carboxymuconolactone decarboxylase family protein [Dehalococcoidia bacterium]MDP7240342.1 carboxymuconolactone decarboxylase family protein [Dehalococcoidia bacterium]